MAEGSVKILESIGFMPDTARLIYQRYRDSPTDLPADFMGFIRGHLNSLGLPQYERMSHQEALRHVGLSIQTQDAILDPIFEHIFRTKTLSYWAKDTVLTNYAALLARQELLEQQNQEKRAEQESTLPHQRDPSQQPLATATINLTPQAFGFPEAHVAVNSDVEILSNHVSLYKGKALEDWATPNHLIDDDGSILLGHLATYRDGDFNCLTSGFYWSPEKEVAEEYRQYTARRCSLANICIIHNQAPQSFIDSLHMEEQWYSPDWKEYVWMCRKMRAIPQELIYLAQADIIKGHVCGINSTEIARIRRGDVQAQITEQDVLNLPSGKEVTQWMFAYTQMERLADTIRGKMHIIIYEATCESIGLKP